MYVCMYVYISLFLSLSLYIYIYTHVYTYVFVYLSLYIYIYIIYYKPNILYITVIHKYEGRHVRLHSDPQAPDRHLLLVARLPLTRGDDRVPG